MRLLHNVGNLGLGRPLCLMQGSSFAYWLTRRLFTAHPDVFDLDLGQALHALFYDDRSIPLLDWGVTFAPGIVLRCYLEDYTRRLGIPAPVIPSLFGDRVPAQILADYA